MLMMRPPPWRFMMGMASRAQRNGPVRFTARTFCQVASDSSSNGPPSNAPELLMSTSTRPNSRMARAKSALT